MSVCLNHPWNQILDTTQVKPKDTMKTRRKPFPYEMKPLDADLTLELLKDFTGERTGFVQVGPKKWFFPSGFVKQAEDIYNFEFRKDDIVIVTFPRSGTTWTQEMSWLLANDLDYSTAANIPLTDRYAYLEFGCFVHKQVKEEFLQENMYDPEKYRLAQEIDRPGWEIMEKTKGKRFIKTHLPFSLLSPNLFKAGCKIIYVARNPKDVAVSFYHLNRSIRTQGYNGDFKKYWYYFKNNLQPWTPYWEHLHEGWKMRNEENMLFLFYEDMNKNLRPHIESVSAFLGKSYTSEQLDKLEDHLKIENFKKNKSVNYEVMKELGIILKTEESFVRKGKTGGWKNYFDEEMEKEADEWIKENLKNTDLRFPL